MLFTRCPECDTTFRVTDETLKKASGQVRCGRCASVFNAYAELHDPSAKSFEPEPPPRGAVESPPPAASVAERNASGPPVDATSVATPAPAPPDSKPPDHRQADATAVSIGGASVADVVAESELAAKEASAADQEANATAEAQPMPATEVERVLTTDVVAPIPLAAYVWPASDEKSPRSKEWKWTAAAAVALFLLGMQVLHHFRTDVAGHATFGPFLAAAYRMVGAELAPTWDVRQYEILDWVATAEPNERGLGSLKITARIQNRGPQRQPYPAVQLRLKDRWEEAVGSRTFSPSEYLPSDAPRGRLMSPGETARAELEVVDPGPDAFGFELDVCIEVEASLVTCRADEVFSDARAAR